MDAQQFPIGKFDRNVPLNRQGWTTDIEQLPALIKEALAGLPAGGIDKPYRPGGWTGRQVVHHLADSHMNLHVRLRLALTEEKPIIKPYDEVEWAKLVDAERGPLDPSLAIIEGVHARSAALLKALSDEQWRRQLVHPVTGDWTVEQFAGLYSWHGRHHAAHLKLIR